MSNQGKPSLMAPLGGVVVGVAVFLGVNITTGRAIIPTTETVVNQRAGLSEPQRPLTQTAGGGAPAANDTYHTICITCHQADGQGVPNAFPPLAGSEWLTAPPELPIHIVLLGLSGPIEVKGSKFNAVMPPPPGMTDEKIADALSFARTHFGNSASKVEPAQVAKVRASLGGRTAPLTTDELRALRASLSGGGEGQAGGAAGAPGEAAPAQPAEPAAPAAAGAPKPGAPKPATRKQRGQARPAAPASPAAQ